MVLLGTLTAFEQKWQEFLPFSSRNCMLGNNALNICTSSLHRVTEDHKRQCPQLEQWIWHRISLPCIWKLRWRHCKHMCIFRAHQTKIHLVKTIHVDKVRWKNKVMFVSQGEDRIWPYIMIKESEIWFRKCNNQKNNHVWWSN